jgi:hypothetical protein
MEQNSSDDTALICVCVLFGVILALFFIFIEVTFNRKGKRIHLVFLVEFQRFELLTVFSLDVDHSISTTENSFPDDPPAYTSVTAIVSNDSQETPPPKYNNWFSDQIFKVAIQNSNENTN